MAARKKNLSVIFLCRKPGSVHALKWLLSKRVDVRAIVCPSTGKDGKELRKLARTHRIPFYTSDATLYAKIARQNSRVRADLVISYLYPKKIRMPLIALGERGCINFHPAPLPENKGRAGYNTAILEQKKQFGVSAHFIDSEKLDAGPIISVLRFPMDPNHDTVLSLEKKTQEKLVTLFKNVLSRFLRGSRIPVFKNEGGTYLSARELESLKKIMPSDTPEDIHRKIRAFFFPPYTGATIELKGETFTLIDQEILDMLAKLLEKTPTSV